jgi:HSP20 family molecular chaperone IbpA
MLSEAIDTLARAERLHQQFFSLQSTASSREPSWEPPIDVLETEREVLILVALPGVDPDQVVAVIEDGMLIISGRRVLPAELQNARYIGSNSRKAGSSAASCCPPGVMSSAASQCMDAVGLRPVKTA